MFPLDDEIAKSNAFKEGICRDCGTQVEEPGSRDRCNDCYDKYNMYAASGYGLDEDATKARNQELGNCPNCGGVLDGKAALCSLCEQNPTQARKRAEGRHKPKSDRNPYKGVWDEPDQFPQYIFTPGYNEMAQRMMAKSRFFLEKAKRGGPRGREYIREAYTYLQIAKKMKAEAQRIKELSK